MKFPYIPIQPVIDEALENVKTIAKTSNYSDSECYNWAIDTSREIGGHAYDTASTEVEIKKHVGFLPNNFYLLEELWKCHPKAQPAETPVRPSAGLSADKWIRTGIMAPLDKDTRRRCSAYCGSSIDNQSSISTFSLKIPPGVIRTSFVEGFVSMDYYALPMHDGQIMIQDEINGIKCIQAYIVMRLSYETWIKGEMRGDVWQSLKDDYETHLKLAQQLQKAIDPSHTGSLLAKQHSRYRNMAYSYQ